MIMTMKDMYTVTSIYIPDLIDQLLPKPIQYMCTHPSGIIITPRHCHISRYLYTSHTSGMTNQLPQEYTFVDIPNSERLIP